MGKGRHVTYDGLGRIHHQGQGISPTKRGRKKNQDHGSQEVHPGAARFARGTAPQHHRERQAILHVQEEVSAQTSFHQSRHTDRRGHPAKGRHPSIQRSNDDLHPHGPDPTQVRAHLIATASHSTLHHQHIRQSHRAHLLQLRHGTRIP